MKLDSLNSATDNFATAVTFITNPEIQMTGWE